MEEKKKIYNQQLIMNLYSKIQLKWVCGAKPVIRLVNSMNKGKSSFKGPVSKWEKKWVTVGQMKLLKWVPLKIKKPTGQLKNKDGIVAKTPNNAPIMSRAKRATGTSNKNDNAEQITDNYNDNFFASLPKTRRAAKKFDHLQKKQLHEAGFIMKEDGESVSTPDDQMSQRSNKAPKKPAGRPKSTSEILSSEENQSDSNSIGGNSTINTTIANADHGKDTLMNDINSNKHEDDEDDSKMDDSSSDEDGQHANNNQTEDDDDDDDDDSEDQGTNNNNSTTQNTDENTNEELFNFK
ncbi:hypothetical protein DLAC_07508 [Tieghemostelium lacteum]|uniref:Uncharacterized protein n=1 Tax=Tieghemostelium lacteum TaxID=361077 RepID=A0A151ZCQ0_TIELA|nr:hypothetical protein DLAC_07508 [Tieghemostelium lacteum]|eukprot:KYQ91726.1 hypothetical protein DLAC_07508 [Tieghemostelium lacteum]